MLLCKTFIYDGLTLIISGGIGCMITLCQDGSFLGFMVFLIYFGGIMIAFCYTTALAIEQYPEIWGSSIIIWSSLLLGLIVEVLLLYWWTIYDQVEILIDCYRRMNPLWWWKCSWFSWWKPTGVAVIYSCNYWLIFMAGWSIFIGIFIAIEVTQGN